jgi:potassium inwardly-rectifying channel subfamily J
MEAPLLDENAVAALSALSGGPRASVHSQGSECAYAEQEASLLAGDRWSEVRGTSRLINKDGQLQVRNQINSRSKFRSYFMQDMFTTALDAPWSYVLLLGAVLYISMWIFFGLLYFFFNNARLPGCQPSQVLHLMDAFLLSIDTQTTIGFGNYAVDSDCVHAVVILVVQCLISVTVNSIFAGFLFTKLSRPQLRATSLIFSRFGCITEENGVRYLTFRIADQVLVLFFGASQKRMGVSYLITEENGGELPNLWCR